MSSEGGQIAYLSFNAYHATKWGIEGFVESVVQEVAPFGIGITLVEPGPAGTNFGAALVRPEPIAAYDDTPVGEIRRALDNGSFEIVGDPDRMAEAMIACGDGDTAPLRLTLGSKAFDTISAGLRSRLTALEAQKEIALSADKQP